MLIKHFLLDVTSFMANLIYAVQGKTRSNISLLEIVAIEIAYVLPVPNHAVLLKRFELK